MRRVVASGIEVSWSKAISASGTVIFLPLESWSVECCLGTDRIAVMASKRGLLLRDVWTEPALPRQSLDQIPLAGVNTCLSGRSPA